MTPAIIDFHRRKLDRVEATWEARGHIDEGDVAFLIRMARCYLETAEPAARHALSQAPSGEDGGRG